MFILTVKISNQTCAQSLARHHSPNKNHLIQDNCPVSNKMYHALPLSYSFLERDTFRICDLTSKPSPASSILMSKLTNNSVQKVFCCFMFVGYVGFVGLYIYYDDQRNSGYTIHNYMYIIYNNTFYFLRYVRPTYVKYLFTNIRKQQNMLKISLIFKKIANFAGK